MNKKHKGDLDITTIADVDMTYGPLDEVNTETMGQPGEVVRLLALIDGLPCDRERKMGRSCLSARELGVMVELCPMCAAKEAAHGG